MVRYLLILLLGVSLHAASLFGEIENIIGKNSFVANKKIITILFKKRENFFKRGRVDYAAVLQVLSDNHLLNTKISRATDISLSFATRAHHPVAFVRLIRMTLNELGYSRIDIRKVIHDQSGFMYKVSVYSDSAPDPSMIVGSFAKKGADVIKIKRFSLANWRYFVDISHMNLVPQRIAYDRKVALPRPLDDYWINVEHAKVAVFKSPKANRWHPKIVFYDRYLNIVDNFSQDRKSYNIRLKVPANARYMKVSDIYTLENLRRGLTLYLAKRR